MLSNPCGIFVDINFTLYITDSGNNRIQLFHLGQTLGTTIVGPAGIIPTSTLNKPTGITIDGNGYLFIVDSGNNRIQVAGSNGVRCVIGCLLYVTSNVLSSPVFMRFDNYGNIFVNELGSNSLKKFVLTTNLCNSDYSSSISMEDVDDVTIASTVSTMETNARETIETVSSSQSSMQPATKEDHTSAFAKTTIDTITGTSKFDTSLRNIISSQSTTTLSTKNAFSQSTQTTTVFTTMKITARTITTEFTSKPNKLSTIFKRETAITSIASTSTAKSSMDSTRMSINNLDHTTTTNNRIVSNLNTITSMKPVPPHNFVPRNCTEANQIGSFCNISSVPCDLAKPCQNQGICTNNLSISHGYICACQSGFNGTNCELNIGLCQMTTCWNHGSCSTLSENRFFCSCINGWEGDHCERRVNNCQNITCSNRGICQSLYFNYKCICFSESHSGLHCEYTVISLQIKQYVAKSFASVAITVISSGIIFIVALDIMRFLFHIDITRRNVHIYNQEMR
ncbi:hypothetical protein I4U23_007339 [Adineta vaga]|nr:hypothetical protein I4U23_007339 [Adineta vaga]